MPTTSTKTATNNVARWITFVPDITPPEYPVPAPFLVSCQSKAPKTMCRIDRKLGSVFLSIARIGNGVRD